MEKFIPPTWAIIRKQQPVPELPEGTEMSESSEEYLAAAGYLLETAKRAMEQAQQAIDRLEKHLKQR